MKFRDGEDKKDFIAGALALIAFVLLVVGAAGGLAALHLSWWGNCITTSVAIFTLLALIF